MGEVGAFLEREHKLYYAKQAGPDGAWAALAPSTLEQKKSGAILRETGAQVAGVSSSVSDREVRIFNQGPDYTIFSQLGTRYQPARKHVGFLPEHPQKILEIIQRQLGF
ncbi:MAG: phage virion morphogenesis protein [Cyanobacteria bacterium SBLK]|nr:phage virion morphogenesis protein [Cyanobacteria bacterium SBLK]